MIQKFITDFKAANGGATPDAMAVLAYDAVNVLAAAIKRAGGTDPESLKSAIRRTNEFDGVSGKITINENRDAMKPAVVLRGAGRQVPLPADRAAVRHARDRPAADPEGRRVVIRRPSLTGPGRTPRLGGR